MSKNKRKAKLVNNITSTELHNYLNKLQIKPKNGRTIIVKRGRKGLFVEQPKD